MPTNETPNDRPPNSRDGCGWSDEESRATAIREVAGYAAFCIEENAHHTENSDARQVLFGLAGFLRGLGDIAALMLDDEEKADA